MKKELTNEQKQRKKERDIIYKMKEKMKKNFSLEIEDKIKQLEIEFNFKYKKEKTKEAIELKKQKRRERDKLRSQTEKRKKWYKNYQKEYISKNREKLNEKANKRTKIRKENDPLFKLSVSVRKIVWRTLKIKSLPKTKKSEELLGCSFEDFKIYLESKFESWMNWENYGNPKDNIFESNKTWDIDHIIPLASAINEKELLELSKYTNLQPLCSYYNRCVKKNNVLE